MNNWTIEFSPLVPMTWLWVAGAVALLLVGYMFWRHMRGSVLRSISFMALLLGLANPTLREEQRDPLSNIVLIIVDATESQKISGREELTSEVRDALSRKLAGIPNLETRWIRASHKGDENLAEGTRLFAELNRGLANIPAERLAGVIMITDGQVHDAPKSPQETQLNVPLHALLTGKRGEFDRRIQLIEAPRFGIVGGSAQVQLKIVETGDKSGASTVARLIIRRKDKADERLTVRVGDLVKIPFDFPHAGQNILEIELDRIKGELTHANNRLVIAAEGVRENLRVLLVSGEPHPGERTWRNLLKSDASVDLVHFTILRPPEKQDGTPINQLSLIAFPTRELFSEKLEEFDLIIFDRYRRRGVLPLIYLDNVSRYVENGGAILLAAGEAFSSPRSLFRTPLSQILPVQPTGRLIEEPFKARSTKDGLKHPVTRGLPGASLDNPSWGNWYRLIEAKTKRGKVLMNGMRNKPLLVLDRRGKGRVALLLSDHAWLWARGHDGGGPYAALLRRLAHWLMKEPDLEEEFLKARGQGRKLIVERRSMNDSIGKVELTTPTGEKKTIELDQVAPGLWRKSIATNVTGLFRLKSQKLSAVTHVGPINSREHLAVTASEEHLAPALKASGGGAFWMGERTIGNGQAAIPRINMMRSTGKRFGSGWLGLAERDAFVVRGVSLTPLFAGFIALGLLLALLAGTWFREGH